MDSIAATALRCPLGTAAADGTPEVDRAAVGLRSWATAAAAIPAEVTPRATVVPVAEAATAVEAGLPAEGTAVAEVAADHLLRELLPHIRSKNQVTGHRLQGLKA